MFVRLSRLIFRSARVTLFPLFLIVAAHAEQVPPTYFGLHVNDIRAWPAVPVKSVRTANISWGAINTARGVYDWSVLDRAVDIADKRGAELSYLLLRTPQWASSKPSEHCYAGNIGCAAPPKDLAQWDTFVRALATRYRGRITSYEIWNEPNDPKFWTGSVDQMVEMARRAYRIIKAVDPKALVISPSPTYTKEGPPHVWLGPYLTAGGGEFADVIGFHGYVATKPETVRTVVAQIRKTLADHNQSSKPLWDTEAGWGRNSELQSPDSQASFLAKSYLIQWSDGVRRFYWYQWDNPQWGTLWDKGQGVRKPGQAFAQIQKWLVGASLEQPCSVAADNTWTCTLHRGASQQKIMWNPSSTVRIPVDGQHTAAERLDGTTTKIDRQIEINQDPVLLH
jgi:hypothetical protein